MNSTLKSLLFWVVLVVVGVVIWNFSTKFGQPRERVVPFSEFMTQVDGKEIARVIITGQDITGATRGGENFRSYAPNQIGRAHV